MKNNFREDFMCDPINSFMAYADAYCLDGPILRRDSITSTAPYANLRVDACAAETCVEVNRDVTFSAGQTRTAQAILHQTDVFLNGSSSSVGNLGISRSLITSRTAREAAIGRLDAYARTHQLPQTCSVNNPCEALGETEIQALKTALESETTSTSTKGLGAAAAALSATALVFLFVKDHLPANTTYLSWMGRIIQNEVGGVARLAGSAISLAGRGITAAGAFFAGVSAGELAIVAVGSVALGGSIHYSGLGHYIGTDWLGEHLGDWLAS